MRGKHRVGGKHRDREKTEIRSKHRERKDVWRATDDGHVEADDRLWAILDKLVQEQEAHAEEVDTGVQGQQLAYAPYKVTSASS